jgi:hypothetical protein
LYKFLAFLPLWRVILKSKYRVFTQLLMLARRLLAVGQSMTTAVRGLRQPMPAGAQEQLRAT